MEKRAIVEGEVVAWRVWNSTRVKWNLSGKQLVKFGMQKIESDDCVEIDVEEEADADDESWTCQRIPAFFIQKGILRKMLEWYKIVSPYGSTCGYFGRVGHLRILQMISKIFDQWHGLRTQ
jgi:hypothetical protein